ncbi:YIP1 family protein [Bacillus cereus]|uniref:YIP1 family protein n=1 Tax=Bacillus cereus TaxID=1396 RepID=UPI0024BC7203|nr:YIP1 family protein [Bacillus cereus]WHT85434.1 YIP1 family protein [Bacillus cereus]
MENISTEKKAYRVDTFNILKVLYSPFEFFEEFNHSKKYILNIFLIIFLNTVVTWVFTSHIQSSSQLQEVISSNKNVITPTFILILKIIMTLGSFIPLLFNCLVNSFFLFILILTVKETISFRRLYYVVFLAQIPLIIKKSLVIIPFFSNENLVPITSLGYILDSNDSDKFFIDIISQFEVFNIWSVILLGIGLSILTNMSLKKSYILSFSFWIVMICAAGFLNVLF